MRTLEGPRSLEEVMLDALVEQLEISVTGVSSTAIWRPLPHQVEPKTGNDGSKWDVWLVLGGRGIGKTRMGTEYVMSHLREKGRSARVGIGAPTFGDARDVCAEGDSGIITLYGHEFLYYNRSLGEARHKSGGFIKFMGTENPARWNGPQWTLLWADELALWNEDSWDQALFGLRLGDWPRAICTTTPKNRKFVRDLSEAPTTAVTRATTADNPYLSERAVARLYSKYGGTKLGRQELLGQWVTDVEGALWSSALIDEFRVPEVAESTLVKVVVAIDPAGTHKQESDFTGITVAGRDFRGEYFVLNSDHYKLSPEGWASRALMLYDKYEADLIVGERNYGGDMVESTIRNVVPKNRICPKIKTVVASRGKYIRAEPVAAMYEQGRVHHVGVHEVLESEMCLFPVAHDNIDAMDSMVWAITELAQGQLVAAWNPGGKDKASLWTA